MSHSDFVAKEPLHRNLEPIIGIFPALCDLCGGEAVRSTRREHASGGLCFSGFGHKTEIVVLTEVLTSPPQDFEADLYM